MGLEPSYYFRFCQSTQSLDALHLHGIHKHLQKLCNFTNAPKFTPTPKLQTFQLLKKKLTLAFVMVEVWWSLLAAIPAVVAGHAFQVKKRRAEEQRLKTARGREKSSDEIFVCERVCTSKRMLKKVGAFSKDPIPGTCVTVCGVSELDACADACVRTVCVNQHQVPNWNDICLRRCQSECLKLSSSSSL